MDNQYNQPGGGYPPQSPTGQQPMGYPPAGYGMDAGVNPQQGYGSPYGVQQGYANPGAPYGAQQGYTNPADPYGVQQGYANPADPYGVQQGYANPADPYGAQQGYANPADPYGAQQGYTNPADPYGAQQGYTNAVDPYGTVQQPYADPGAYQQPYSDDGYQHLFNQEQLVQEQPPSGFPPQQRKPERRRLTGSDIALIVVAMVAVLGFAGWYLYSTYAPEAARYGVIASGSLSATHSGSCLIVRNEVPYDAEGVTSVAYDAKEGSRVIRNAAICRVYSTGYSASAMRQLQEYRDEIRDYQEQMIESSTVYDGKLTRYNTDVMTLVREIRSLISGDQGSLSNLEDQLTQQVEERQTYINQKYASDQRFSRMQDDVRSQSQRIDSWTKQYTATMDALVSFYSDGYEYSVNGSTYAAFEPDEVRAMINGRKPEQTSAQKGKTTIYRMVKDNEWYVLFLSDNTDWDPVKGETYELQLERFGETPVTAEVVSFTRSGGELLVRLRIAGSVEEVLYLRTCDALLGESMSTLMVNERAIYVQDGMTGVVVLEDSTESFIPVNVLHYDEGNAYFQTVQQGILYEGLTVRLF